MSEVAYPLFQEPYQECVSRIGFNFKLEPIHSKEDVIPRRHHLILHALGLKSRTPICPIYVQKPLGEA